MKKYVLMMMIASIGMASNAQTKFSLGPNAGVGATWIDNFDNKMGKTHGNFGISMIYSAVEHFGIGLDVKYSFEGGKREFNTNIAGTSFRTEEEVNLNYLRLPLKAMFFFNQHGNRFRPKIAVGPSFGFLMGGNHTAETTSPNGNIVSETSMPSKDHWENFDLGLHGSLGLNYRLVERTWLQADVGYYHGLSDIMKNNTGNIKYHNRNLALNIGVNFGL